LKRAIIESDPFTLPLRRDAISLGERFSKDLGCNGSDVDCLRSKSVEEILAAQKEAQVNDLVFNLTVAEPFEYHQTA